jgi:hypothetical protein
MHPGPSSMKTTTTTTTTTTTNRIEGEMELASPDKGAWGQCKK